MDATMHSHQPPISNLLQLLRQVHRCTHSLPSHSPLPQAFRQPTTRACLHTVYPYCTCLSQKLLLHITWSHIFLGFNLAALNSAISRLLRLRGGPLLVPVTDALRCVAQLTAAVAAVLQVRVSSQGSQGRTQLRG